MDSKNSINSSFCGEIPFFDKQKQHAIPNIRRRFLTPNLFLYTSEVKRTLSITNNYRHSKKAHRKAELRLLWTLRMACCLSIRKSISNTENKVKICRTVHFKAENNRFRRSKQNLSTCLKTHALYEQNIFYD